MPNYNMRALLLPKVTSKGFDKYIRKFWWGDQDDDKKRKKKASHDKMERNLQIHVQRRLGHKKY